MFRHKKDYKTRSNSTKRLAGQSLVPRVVEGALDQVKIFARGCFDKASGSHGWDHTLRVFRLCEMLGPAEDADMDVLSAAAYLHDIGRTVQDASNGSVCHAQRGVQMAEPLVNSLPFSEERRHNILHCIRSHRFRNPSRPATIEAKVLFDADKLDAIGAVGVARAFLFAGELGARLHNPDCDIEKTRPYSVDDTGYREFKVKLCRIKERMLTAAGRKWARERHVFMEDFFKRFLAEYEGKR
ncbi:MAG: HD domain-containing protein [Desulfobacterales bacterium]|jgi:uncharacterized protein